MKVSWQLCLASIVVLTFSVSGFCQEWVEDVTTPSQVAELSFERPGKIAELLVREGDIVSDGQLLARLDDEADLLQIAQLKAQAEDTIQIDAAKARYSQSKVDLTDMQELTAAGGATKQELEHAKLNMLIAKLSLDMARFQQKQNKRKLLEAQALIKRTRLVSNMNGRVQEILLRRGECTDGRQKIFRLVKIDPLWINVPVATADAMKLRVAPRVRVAGKMVRGVIPPESRVQVKLGGKESADIIVGVIIFKSAEVAAGSDKLIVRVEIPNGKSLASGLRAWVRFPSLWRADGKTD